MPQGVECTVIAYDVKDTMKPYLIGWKREEAHLAERANVSHNMLTGGGGDPRNIQGCRFISHINQYEFNNWVSGGTMCTMVGSAAHPGGMKCGGRYCGVYVQYATPNQKDGSFLCYSCRQRPLCMTQTTKE